METLPSHQTDGNIWKEIQAKYGEKPKEQRKLHKQLDKDDFLKIMVTQMQHQDPTSPMDADKLAAQIAQMTSVEQLQNVNSALKKMTENNRPLERMNMTNLIGKIATIDENRFVHVQGKVDSIQFKVSEEIAKGKLQIISDKGEIVLEKELGNMKPGVNTINWDGKKSNTTDALNGNYTVRFEAENEKGLPVQMSTLARSKIIGVSFEGSEPFFLVGDAKQQKRIGFESILSVETADSQPASGGGSTEPMGLIDNNPTKKFFGFEKGKGSTAIGPDNLEPAVANILKSYKQPEAQHAERPVTKGFPNGLGDKP